MPVALQPRLIRYRDAPSYCGVGRRVFDRDIRPWLIVIRVGKVGIAFDRLDLDAWIEQHKFCSGRPPEKGDSWDAQERRESFPTKMETRLSTRSTKADRKSTRLNSSHSQISYAVFCLKKKKHNIYTVCAHHLQSSTPVT